MASVTIKNIPSALHEALKHSAKQQRRSINNEVIVLLENALLPIQAAQSKPDPSAWAGAIDEIRKQIPVGAVSNKDIHRAISHGR